MLGVVSQNKNGPQILNLNVCHLNMEEYVHVGQGRKPSYKLKTNERVSQNSS